MNRERVKRFFKRNCINIPFYTLFLVVLVVGCHICDQKPVQTTWKFDVAYAADLMEYTAPDMSKGIAAAEPGEAVEPVEMPEIEDPGCTGSIEGMIIRACEYYGVDAELAVAISRLETGHFQSAACTELNNVGGMSVNETPIAFTSLEEGVDAFVQNLANNYIAQGLLTVEMIGAKYCPGNADEWVQNVTAIMEEYGK